MAPQEPAVADDVSDDALLLADSPLRAAAAVCLMLKAAEYQAALDELCRLLNSLGFTVSAATRKKPTQDIIFLGIRLRSNADGRERNDEIVRPPSEDGKGALNRSEAVAATTRIAQAAAEGAGLLQPPGTGGVVRSNQAAPRGFIDLLWRRRVFQWYHLLLFRRLLLFLRRSSPQQWLRRSKLQRTTPATTYCCSLTRL
jgi:hypothetical protein